MAPLLRRARLADLPHIVGLLADDEIGKGREDAGPVLNELYTIAFEAIDQDANQFLMVVEEDGEIVGFLQLTFIPGLARLGLWRGQIESVRIASKWRSSGLGTTMLNWAIAECRLRGCGLVQLTTDKSRPKALQFYERLGFVASHEGLKLILKDPHQG